MFLFRGLGEEIREERGSRFRNYLIRCFREVDYLFFGWGYCIFGFLFCLLRWNEGIIFFIWESSLLKCFFRFEENFSFNDWVLV